MFNLRVRGKKRRKGTVSGEKSFASLKDMTWTFGIAPDPSGSPFFYVEAGQTSANYQHEGSSRNTNR